MHGNLRDRQVMINHLISQQSSQNGKQPRWHSSQTSLEQRKVTFNNDVCESGYSTTASSDDGANSPLKSMTSDKAFQIYASTPDAANKRQQFKQRKGASSSVSSYDEAIHQQRGYAQQTQSYTETFAPSTVSMTPSPTSPVLKYGEESSNSYYYVGDSYGRQSYYDPLHLSSNINKSDYENAKWRKTSQSDADVSETESSASAKRGILKKPRTLQVPRIQMTPDTPLEDSASFTFGSPTKFHSHSSQVSPIRVPAVYPSEHKTPSPLVSSDGSRKSAFTPVIPRKQRLTSGSDLSDISSSNIFTPVKGPAVSDYVTGADQFDIPPVDPLADELFLGEHAGFHTHYVKPSPLRVEEPQFFPKPSRSTKSSRVIGDLSSLSVNDRSETESLSTAETNSSVSPTPKVESLTNDAVRLDQFLDGCSAKDLKRMLKEKLESKDPKCIRALSTLIPASVAKQTMSHCVRCHKSYNPSERGRCYLPHPESMVYKVSQDDEGANFQCQCCSTGFRLLKMDFYEESTNALLTGHCYSGQHTSHPESVDYRTECGAAKSCEENGCVEFYV